MKTKRENRTTFAWTEQNIVELLARDLFNETGVVVEPSQIMRQCIKGHPQFVNYAVVIKEPIT